MDPLHLTTSRHNGTQIVSVSGELGILLSVHDRALSRHTPVHRVNLPPPMRRLLRIPGLDRHLTW
ncbi:hypothetical protein ABZW11_37515 [Nonomuraea sp. NPDC004580]|uniref:hypothetical protein n=1 Tax=Nonomuraea sp. NPDC004580 TaxID=3154552 RepID=UPI0033B60BEE